MTEEALKAVRAQIDAIDREVLRLINERGRCAIEVGRIKRGGGTDTNFYRPEREAEVLRRIRDSNPGPLASADAVRIIREVMSACLALEQPLTVAYLGPAGTYTHAAAQKHFGNSASFLPLPTIEDIVRQVEEGTASFGVTPIENSLEGPINQSHDLLFASRLQVCGEVVLPIHHQLLTRATDSRALSRIYAHGQALAQCRRWLSLNCPQAEQIALSSNAEAARRVSSETAAAAIAGNAAAALYELPILAANIEDQADNTTRFLVIGSNPVPPSGDDLTSLAFCTANRSGALCDALQAFSSASISMTRIQSRPLRQGTWEYIFFADIVGHRDEPVVAAALQRLAQSTSMCRVLGSYPRAII
ncbi:MAG: prephenate dehydratase [Gammaproteobacteria bacterium]|nr:prephenate dehydratase [Gammaproteobacteria bacterium]